jgi:hypothetical protein
MFNAQFVTEVTLQKKFNHTHLGIFTYAFTGLINVTGLRQLCMPVVRSKCSTQSSTQ